MKSMVGVLKLVTPSFSVPSLRTEPKRSLGGCDRHKFMAETGRQKNQKEIHFSAPIFLPLRVLRGGAPRRAELTRQQLLDRGGNLGRLNPNSLVIEVDVVAVIFG